MMTLTFDLDIQQAIPTIQLGLLEATGVTNHPYDPALWTMLTELEEHVRRKWQGQVVAELPPVAATRRAYRALQDDPTRYRPSNEALLRRVLSRRALPQINVAVDINTYVSLDSGFALGCYDIAKLAGPIILRRGHPGERYAPIGKPEVDATNRLVLADEQGIFGSPTADSERTMVTTETKHLLFVIFTFETTEAAVEHALERAANLLTRFCDTPSIERRVVRTESQGASG